MVDLPPPDSGIEIVIASRGISKGLAQTEGPQLVAKPFVQFGSVQLGAQWKNVNSSVAGGEGAAFISISPKLENFQVSFGVAHKFQTGVREPTDDHSWEFNGSIVRKFNRLSLRLAAVYSPDDLGSARRSLFVEAGPTLELGKTTRVAAAIGRRSRVNGDDYTAFSAGLAKTLFKGVTADVRWYDTNRSGLGFPYRGRGVIGVRMAF
jgi:hypothetical protein